jgi:hypothetical protein
VANAGLHDHFVSLLAINAARPLPILLANDGDSKRQVIESQIVMLTDVVKLTFVKCTSVRRHALQVVRAYESRAQDLGGQVLIDSKQPRISLCPVARYHRWLLLITRVITRNIVD